MMIKKEYIIVFLTVLLLSQIQLPLYSQSTGLGLDSENILTTGLDYYKQQNYTQAIDAFQQAAVLDSRNLMIPYYIARCYDILDNLDNATFYYKKALDMNINFAAGWYNLGLVYYRQGRHDDAISCFEMATKRDKELSFAYYNLGNIYFKQNKFQASIDNYQKAIKFNDEYPDSYYNLATVYHKINQPQQAIKFYEKYCNLQPQDSTTKQLLQTLKNQGKG